MPPEQKTEPVTQASPPPQPDLITPPVVKEKPPPEKVQLDDVEVAHDAPVSGNDSKTHKGEPDKETKAPRVAPPPKLAIAAASAGQAGAGKGRDPIRGETRPAVAAPRSRKNSPTTNPMPRRSTRPSPRRPPAKPQPKPKQQASSKTPPAQGQKARWRNSSPPWLRRPPIPSGPPPKPRRSAAEPKKRAMNPC